MLTAPILYNIIPFIMAATCAFALSPLCLPLARRLGAVDVPSDSRRMHRRPTPRLGGLGVFFAFAITSPFFGGEELLPLLSGGGVIVSSGILDDVYGLTPRQKLGFQTAAGGAAVAFGARSPFGEGWLSVLAALFWLILLPNAFNLIDGLDGLCTRTAMCASAALLAVSGEASAAALLGALAGFLPFNLRPARMFLGDTGALFIGFALGVLSLDTAGRMSAPEWILFSSLVFALPLGDTVFSFFRRLIRGGDPFRPDKGHFHHRLVDAGFSHGRASLLLSLSSLALCSVGVMLFSLQ